jgi:methyltransferase-like protein/2-polyprenyl-3-methyl-5-hydroxy-6-metoxy-1,4-benzoquinol methylase
MTPAPIDRCRVLELGCASGGNLISMGLTLPGSTFVGIDFSPRQIADGQAVVEHLGLRNVELKPLSILDVGDDFGTFDYIVCHGVWSWVPPAVQEGILRVCKRRLAPNGVAYISYNTYPGWHMWAILREMVNFHTRHFEGNAARVRQARAFLDLIARAVEGSTNVYGRLLEEEAGELRKQGDAYLFHEHLEEVNVPVYFHEFVARAAAHGLQYLEEAAFSPLPSAIAPEVVDALQRLPVDLVHREQYYDFLRGRSFRRTLLCHADVPLRRPPAAEAVMGMYAAALARPVADAPDVESTTPEEFQALDGKTASTNDPVIKTALCLLGGVWPRTVAFADLWAAVAARLERAEAARDRLALGPPLLAEALLHCCLGGLVELHTHPPRFSMEPGERPVASPLARLQAAGSELVTNLRHRGVELNGFDRAVVSQLDGSRDRPALRKALAELAARGVVTIDMNGQPLRDPEQIDCLLEQALPASLQRLATYGLLVP